MQDLFDQRFSEEGYAYGSEPNEFFKAELDKLTPGKILLIAEGEGRNGVYAAQTGWEADAVDFSQEGKKKALGLALEKGVKLNYTVQDLKDFEPEKNYYDACALIYVHLEDDLRAQVHRKVIKALKPGGVLIMEVFDKDQLGKQSGGPKDIDLLYSLETIVTDFSTLDFISLSKELIELNEGKYHRGEASVIRFVGARVE